ncbi:DMT family transporter [Ramlibacter sp.]|uniref:DMT family transporter n=1 Tax=Ramlibacter sp. TaxID=1917967 RepID=UPI0035ADD4FB
MRALWMIVASLLFALMGVCIKFAATSFSSAEMIFYRGVIGMLFMWGFARMEGVSLRTAVPWMHAWRSLIGIIALGAWFYAIAYLPLATANALNYMSSIWIAVFVIAGALMSWMPGRRREAPVQASLLLSVIAGFAGVALLLRPELPSDQLFAGLIGVLSSIAAAMAYLQVAALSRSGEPESRTVFYFGLGCALGGGAWMAVAGMSPLSWPAAAWLLPIGLLAALGQWCMTRAYSDATSGGTAIIVANLQYTGILFSALLGALIFGDELSALGWCGIALIIGSGVASTALRVTSAPRSPAEEH